MPYTWANYSSTSSSATYITCPQWTTTGTTIITLSNVTSAPYMWQTTSSGTAYAPDWTWNQTPLPAYQPPSREELDRMAAEKRRRTEQYRARRAGVAERAEALLMSLLTPLQAYSYRERGWFEVTGSAGGRYRINRNGQAGNIDELAPHGDDRVASLCIHPYGGFHDADAHAAQYLALVTDEPGFRRTANRTPRRRLQAA